MQHSMQMGTNMKTKTNAPVKLTAPAKKTGSHHRSPDTCPVMRALDLIANKWTVPVIYNLYCTGAPVRFGELLRKIETITQKELTKRLRELERAGLIERRVYPEVPPRVEYELTEIGITLVEPLTALSEWAKRYSEVIEQHRRKYSARTAARAIATAAPAARRTTPPPILSY